MNTLAESYVKLVLQVGFYDADFVDAYYGPDEWKPADPTGDKDDHLKKLEGQSVALAEKVKTLEVPSLNEMDQLRFRFLSKQLTAIRAKIQMLLGKNSLLTKSQSCYTMPSHRRTRKSTLKKP